jgi:hypothetical protein
MKSVKIFKKSILANLESEINSYISTHPVDLVSVEFIFDGKEYVALVVFKPTT